MKTKTFDLYSASSLVEFTHANSYRKFDEPERNATLVSPSTHLNNQKNTFTLRNVMFYNGLPRVLS